ncbi:MAG TPA: M56 family metallopeptidase [Gemmatimonadales bacterium]|nr:M56 family metallopeptidase [Gemmatimonadales bacterium]
MSPGALSFLVLLVKITGVLLAAVLASAIMTRTAASSRHLVWLTALAALLLLPAVANWAPITVPLLPAVPPATAAPPSQLGSAIDRGGIATPLPEPQTATVPTLSERGVTPSVANQASLSLDIGTALLLGWAAIAFLLLGRLVYGVWSVRRIVRRARPLDAREWQTPLYEIADRMELSTAPRLVRSTEVQMPFAAGLVSPMIVLPAESDGWSAERRSAVLVHELGHVRRRDLIGHTLGRLACAFYWFHPLVWTAARRLRAESERACDDLALVFGARPSDYAEHLLEIVTCVRDHHTPAVALAMAHRKEFEGRMLAILDPSLRRKTAGRLQSAGIAAVLGGFALLLAAAAPVARKAAVRPSPTQQPNPAQAPWLQTSDTLPSHTAANADTATHSSAKSRSAAAPEKAERLVSSSSQPSADRVSALVHTLQSDPSASIRRVAAWGLAEFTDSTAAMKALLAAVQSDSDASVREMAAWALGNSSNDGGAAPVLISVLQHDRSPQVRYTATWALGAIGDQSAVTALAAVLGSSDPRVREMAAWAIGACGPDRAPAALIRALTDSARDVRASVAWALYAIADPASVSALSSAFTRETDPDVRLDLIRALGVVGEPAVDALEKLVTSPDTAIRRIAVAELAQGGASGPWVWPRPWPRPFAESGFSDSE